MARLGIVAEDSSDCAALIVLAKRILALRNSPSPGFKKWAGNGCCRIHSKAAPTMSKWAREGVEGVIIVHDLDRDSRNNSLNDEKALRSRLERATANAPGARLICIPVEEIEAWFWCDQKVLDHVAGAPDKAKARHEPHQLTKPKEALMRLSQGLNRKPRYDTNQNEELAALLDLDLCTQRCPAFAQLRQFVERFAA